MLDVGTGNGAFAFKLCKKRFNADLKGIDYSEASIKLATAIRDYLAGESESDSELQQSYREIQLEFQNAFDLVDEGLYDVIHDKGTFDVVYMHPELSNAEYAKAMRFRMNPTNSDAVFVITSCNLTGDELDEIFVGPSLFKKLTEIKGYRSFTYGGVTGQVVSTNVYQIS